jgi:hypothetical protein
VGVSTLGDARYLRPIRHEHVTVMVEQRSRLVRATRSTLLVLAGGVAVIGGQAITPSTVLLGTYASPCVEVAKSGRVSPFAAPTSKRDKPISGWRQAYITKNPSVPLSNSARASVHTADFLGVAPSVVPKTWQAKPISAWRRAYIAEHHHVPPVS